MAFYPKKTQKCWVWLAYDRDGKRACGVQLQTGKKLWEQFQLFKPEQVCTDYYPVYEHLVPSNLHVITKAETWGVESLNSRIRHYLARFRRKTFCYSKALHMVQATLTLFFTPDWQTYLY